MTAAALHACCQECLLLSAHEPAYRQLTPPHVCVGHAGAGLPTFYLTVEGPLASFPPLTDATLATFATQIAAGLNLPPPYSAANLVTWFERATLDASTGQQVLRVVVGYAVMPEAAQSIPLLAIADSPTTVVSIADGLHSAASFVTDPAAALVITASDAAGHARGTAVPISGERMNVAVRAHATVCCKRADPPPLTQTLPP